MQQPDFIPSDEDLEAAFNGTLPETEQPEKADTAPEVPEKEEPEEVAEDAPEEVTEAEIDYDQQIPMSDGREPMTVGQMKDRVTELERDQSKLDEYRMKVVSDEQLMQQFVQATGVEIPQEFRQQIAKKQEAYLSEQHRLMINMMPELGEQATFDKVKPRIFEQAAKSNFSPEEVGQWTDPRYIHMAKRLAEYEDREQTAKETAEQVHKAKPAKGSKPRAKTKQSAMQQRIDAAKSSRNDDERMSVIDDLLTG